MLPRWFCELLLDLAVVCGFTVLSCDRCGSRFVVRLLPEHHRCEECSS